MVEAKAKEDEGKRLHAGTPAVKVRPRFLFASGLLALAGRNAYTGGLSLN